MARINKQIQSCEHIIANQEAEAAKLHAIIGEADTERQRQKKEFDAVTSERTLLRSQLVKRDAELAVLYDKLRLQVRERPSAAAKNEVGLLTAPPKHSPAPCPSEIVAGYWELRICAGCSRARRHRLNCRSAQGRAARCDDTNVRRRRAAGRGEAPRGRPEGREDAHSVAHGGASQAEAQSHSRTYAPLRPIVP